jgi:hypothetical protein
MGKTIFVAVIAAILASIATTLVMASFHAEERSADAEARAKADQIAQIERERLERRVAEVEKKAAAAPRAERRSAPEEAPAGGEAKQLPFFAPDGTPYVSMAQLQNFAKTQGAALVRDAMKGNAAVAAAEKKSLEDIARDMNLSAGEEANLRNVLRDSEEEMVRSLFGDKPLDDVKREILEAKDDPEKQAAMMQGVFQTGFANVGKLMTLERRTKKKVEAVLGADRAAKFLATPRKSVIAPEFEEVLKGGF